MEKRKGARLMFKVCVDIGGTFTDAVIIDNKGKKYTSLSIQKVINHHGRIEELNKILEHMVHEKKLIVEIVNFTPYYSINLDE